jgi:mono/diheme cytochrome c family protein
MKVSLKTISVILGGFFALSACKQGANVTKVQYMPDMADAPTVKAQENVLNPPDHSVTINAILYPESYEQAEAELRNPFGEGAQASEEIRTKGKKLYETYCTPCHGADGKGKGTLGDAYPIPVPDITRTELQAKKDGYFFLRISKGGELMPAYGYAISPHERWWITSYIRDLQQASGSAPAPAAQDAAQPDAQQPQTQPK